MFSSKLSSLGAIACLFSIQAFAGAIGPNFFRGTDGSTVSSPITFESFIAGGPVAPAFTDAIFVFTINDDTSAQTSPTPLDNVELFYGALTSGQQSSSFVPIGSVNEFNTPCTMTINSGTTQTYPALDCVLTGTDGDPNTVGSFANDFESGNGVSLVLACYANCVNTQDKFIFTANAPASTSNQSLTLLPPAGVPEPSAISLVLLGAIAMLGWRSRFMARAIGRARQ